MRLELEILMLRSIGAAPRSAAEIEPHAFVEWPGAGVMCGFQGLGSPLREGTRPSPASLETLMKVTMHMLLL